MALQLSLAEQGTADSRRSTDGTYASILRRRSFLRYALARAISNFGDGLAIFALFTLISFRMRGTAAQVAMVMVAYVAPIVFPGAIAGVLVEKWNLKRTLIAGDLIRATIIALAVFARDLHHLYALIALLSLVSCFCLPAHTLTLRQLVQKEELLVANSIQTQAFQLNRLVTPLIAAMLAGWVGESICFALDSGSFLISAALLSTISFEEVRSPGKASVAVSIGGHLREAISFIALHPVGRFMILTLTTTTLAMAVFEGVLPVYVRDVLSSTSSMFGNIASVTGMGTIMGALALGKFARNTSRAQVVTAGFFQLAAAMFLLAATASMVAALTAGFLLGSGSACIFIAGQTLMMEETPTKLLGRVSSACAAVVTLMQLVGFSVSGVAAGAMGVRTLYYVVTTVTLATALAAACGGRRLRRSRPSSPAVAEEPSSLALNHEAPVVGLPKEPSHCSPLG